MRRNDMVSRNYLHLLPLVTVILLTGCVKDSASYVYPEPDHAVTLMRNQNFFWLNKLQLDVVAVRLPDCNSGIRVKDVPRFNKLSLYQAPDIYPEPILILNTGKRYFAISTQSCQVQKFDEAPAELGEMLGQFYEKDGIFQFVAGKGE
jgi:hypothetical protein